MRVEHTSPAPDLDLKVSAALFLEMPNGETVRIDRWSLASMAWPKDGPDRPEAGVLCVPFQGVDVRFDVTLEPDPEGSDLLFVGLTGRQRETLAIFYRSLLSGRMVPAGDVIQSLDTPVDLVPMEETETEKAKALDGKWKHARLFKAIMHVLVYSTIMLSVIGVVGNNILTNIDRIDVRHGRVQAPVHTLNALRDSYVTGIVVQPGDRVKAGDVLVRMRDPRVSAKLDEARTLLSDAEKERDRLDAAMARLDDLRFEEVETLRLAGVARIFETYVSRRGFEDLIWRWEDLRDQDPVLADDYDPLNITYRALEAQLQDKIIKVRTYRARRDGQKGLAAATYIFAPTDGIVGEIFVRKKQFLAQSMPVLSIEQHEARAVVGWVSERFSETLHIGMKARIGVNVAGEKHELAAVVTNVAAGGIPDRPGEYGIVVTATPVEMAVEDVRHFLSPGAPVRLEAEKQLFDPIKSWANGMLAMVTGGENEQS